MKLIEDYNYYLTMERAMSQNTVASYCSDVEKFLEAIDLRPEFVSTDDITGYLSSRDGLSKRSQARVLSSLKSFFGWLVAEGVMKDDPCDRVDAPKLGRYLPDVLSIQEVEDIIDVADLSSWLGCRDRALVEVLYGCGLRVSEAIGLRVSMIYFDEGFVRVVGKGNKERLVPLGDMAADAIRAYMAVRTLPADAASSDILFLNRYGKPLSRVTAFKTVKTMALLAGVLCIITIFSAVNAGRWDWTVQEDEVYEGYLKRWEGALTEDKLLEIEEERILLATLPEKAEDMKKAYAAKEITWEEYCAYTDELFYVQTHQAGFQRLQSSGKSGSSGKSDPH